MTHRIMVQWTETAKKQLAKLPVKVRLGILKKANALREHDDPSKAHRPLVGPLARHYRLTYGRYRAVYTIDEEKLAGGDILMRIIVTFIAVGKRKEHDRQDVYRIAERIVKFGLANMDDSTADSED